MGVFITLIVLSWLGYYFLVYKTNHGEKPSDIADSLVVYDDSDYNKSEYIVGYNPIDSDTKVDNYPTFRRYSLLIDNTTPTRYNNGEVATVRLHLDIDHYLPNDLVAIEDKLNLLILSKARKLKNHFYYLAAPLGHLTESDFSFARIGAKVYRLNRELTDAENKYLLKNKLDLEAATYKFKDFNPPYKPHKQGGYVSTSSSYRSSSNDIVDDFMMNPLLSPISPINIWGSDDSSSSSSDSSWSSYDSGSSDSGDSGGSCD